ncbi:hypothetical protein [Acetivibrio straminisolvens]|nr:hypothetical protein [Acetivibrio straminisolvens]
MNKKRFKAILASLQIIVFSIVQASQVLAVHGAIEQKTFYLL